MCKIYILAQNNSFLFNFFRWKFYNGQIVSDEFLLFLTIVGIRQYFIRLTQKFAQRVLLRKSYSDTTDEKCHIKGNIN